jgi:hypothetical protein
MSPLASKGRLIFVVMATIVIVSHVVYILDGAVEGWMNKASVKSELSGAILGVAVLYWLSRGSSVAWWLIVVLFVVTGLMSLQAALTEEKPSIFNVSLPTGWPDPVFALSGLADLSFVGVLVLSRSVRGYLDFQRKERRDSEMK